jgi:catechol 2,3-dioxygenase-like lactoylglutathione lyase family enzyme
MTGINSFSLVCVPVTDQEASLDFYVGKLGLDKRTDTPFGGGYRWIEVYVGDEQTGIALAPPPPGQSVEPMQTGITFDTGDVDALHAELKGKGVDVDAEITRMGAPVPDMFWFRDPDGHTLMAVQPLE